MNVETLYNGKRFPEYIFTQKMPNCLFFEFDFIFDQEYWNIFKNFLEENGVKKIVIENVVPDYLFREEIDVNDLPESFTNVARTENLKGYFPFKSHFYMLTEICIAYPVGDKNLFCLVLDREFEIGILASVNSKKLDEFKEFEIKDVPDYLRLPFGGKCPPKSFMETLYKNWNIPDTIL